MGRRRLPEGKRNVIGLKVSDAKFQAVEAARGDLDRAVWVEAAIDAALGLDSLPPRIPAPAAVRKAVKRGAGAVTVPAATRQRCAHPGTRLIGGFCRECDHLIEPGGYWREL